MTSLAPIPMPTGQDSPNTTSSVRYGKLPSREPSRSALRSTLNTPKTMSRKNSFATRTPGATPRMLQYDTIEESGYTPEWIIFGNTDFTQSKLSTQDLRRKLVDHFPFLLDAENKARNCLPRARSRLSIISLKGSKSPSRKADAEDQGDEIDPSSALQFSISACEVRQVMRVKFVTEARSFAWRPVAVLEDDRKDAEPVPLPAIDKLPSAWALSLDTRTMARRSLAKISGTGAVKGTLTTKRTFELPDMRTVAKCNACCSSAEVQCDECHGVDAPVCFWCDGTGHKHKEKKHKACPNCNGNGRTICHKCNNTGRKQCGQCNGLGKLVMGLIVEVKIKIREMPPISLSTLRRSGRSTPNYRSSSSGYVTPPYAVAAAMMLEGSSSGTPGDEQQTALSLRSLASARISQLAQDYVAAQGQRSNPAQPVLALCEFEKASVYTVVAKLEGGGETEADVLSAPEGRALHSPIPSIKSTKSYLRQRLSFIIDPLTPESSANSGSGSSAAGDVAPSTPAAPSPTFKARLLKSPIPNLKARAKNLFKRRSIYVDAPTTPPLTPDENRAEAPNPIDLTMLRSEGRALQSPVPSLKSVRSLFKRPRSVSMKASPSAESSASSSGAAEGTTANHATALPLDNPRFEERTLRSPAPSIRSSRSVVPAWHAMGMGMGMGTGSGGGLDSAAGSMTRLPMTPPLTAGAEGTRWAFRVSSCPGVAPIQIA